MEKDTNEIDREIERLEASMLETDFWSDKVKAQQVIKEIAELKNKKEGLGKYDKGNAIVTIISGAGGDDAEDFTGMLFEMYELRHTSFSLVEILPKFSKLDEKEFFIPDGDLKIDFAKSGGPGGQNVNKRETAVRIVHVPTNISVHVSGERSQEANRETAMNMLRAKIFKKAEEEKKTFEESMKINKGTEIEWGSQIRSYVLHPYKMVKDHRTDAETSDVDGVLDGDLELFIEAEKNL
ncbi:MAG: PCRF domain-containing protein [Candidatus Nomurabacteria bacterium]|nr:PCRF domain-containing protein [Candidatus Nomurabacteria bacterium]